jgi:hypothetical protein
MRMLMRGSISILQYLRCVRTLARRKFHAKYVGAKGMQPRAAGALFLNAVHAHVLMQHQLYSDEV